jgi:hypothetical protein
LILGTECEIARAECRADQSGVRTDTCRYQLGAPMERQDGVEALAQWPEECLTRSCEAAADDDRFWREQCDRVRDAERERIECALPDRICVSVAVCCAFQHLFRAADVLAGERRLSPCDRAGGSDGFKASAPTAGAPRTVRNTRVPDFAREPAAEVQLTSHEDGRRDSCANDHDDDIAERCCRPQTIFGLARTANVVAERDRQIEQGARPVAKRHVVPAKVLGEHTDTRLVIDLSRHKQTGRRGQHVRMPVGELLGETCDLGKHCLACPG